MEIENGAIRKNKAIRDCSIGSISNTQTTARQHIRRRLKMEKNKELPIFESNEDCRDYLMDTLIELIVQYRYEVLKKREQKKPAIIRAKTAQFQVLIQAIKTADTLLKNKQMDSIQEQLKLMNRGAFTDVGADDDEIFELPSELQKELADIEKNIELIHM